MANKTIYKGVTIITENFDMVTEEKILREIKSFISKDLSLHDAAISIAVMVNCDVKNSKKGEITFIARKNT